jgi:hypothetical protein
MFEDHFHAGVVGFGLGMVFCAVAWGGFEVVRWFWKLLYRLGILKLPDATNGDLLSAAARRAFLEMEHRLPHIEGKTRILLTAFISESLAMGLRLYLREYRKLTGLDAHGQPTCQTMQPVPTM